MRILSSACLLLCLLVSLASAGSPHFTTCSQRSSGSTITVTGTEAGLGDESQIHIELTATASCINPGDNHPQAANKVTVTAAGDFPVQNGHADFSLTGTAVLQPACSPPMSIVFSEIFVCDTEHDVCCSF